MHEKTPLFHISKRGAIPWYRAWMIRAIGIIAALVLCALVTTITTGVNPLQVYVTIFKGSFASARRFWDMLQKLSILLCVSLAVTPAFRMRFWNIGGEGQVLIGGLATAACMILLGGKLPNWALIILMIVASIAAGAIWGGIPAIFKAKWNTNETLFILVVAVLTVGVYVYLNYSKHGYEIAVVGESERTARYVGIKVEKVIIRTMLLSGAICGIAGLLLVGGTDHTLTDTIAGGRGFTAVMVSWLAKFNPIWMILTSFLLVFLDKGASEISAMFSLNQSFSDILTGIILFFIIGCEFFINYQIHFRKSGKEEK